MSSKNIRNAIIALVIMAIGSFFLIKLGKAFLPKDSPVDFSGIFTSVESLFSLFLIGIIVIILILIPFWVSKRRSEKRDQSLAPL